MAKFKVHMLAATAAETFENEFAALCKTRALLPLSFTMHWRDVTCDRCNRKRPKQAPLWRRFVEWFDNTFMARRG